MIPVTSTAVLFFFLRFANSVNRQTLIIRGVKGVDEQSALINDVTGRVMNSRLAKLSEDFCVAL